MAIDCSKCPNRGCCCGIIPINPEIVEANKDKFQVVPVKIVYDEKSMCYVLTDDLLCVFLNRETKMCEIYDKRPPVCVLYGNTKHPDLQCLYFRRSGNPRSEASKKQVEKHIKRMTDNLMKKYGGEQ